MARVNEATIKEEPSPALKTMLAKLQDLEESVLSEKIPLRNDGSDTLMVSVVVDSKHTLEMCVDSGASLICLPAAMAERVGVRTGSSDPDIILELANGSRVRAKRTQIPSVRVGKFTVKNVECAVLGPEAVSAMPLLGMSFLQNFKFEIDSQEPSLTMVKVEEDGGKPAGDRKTK